MDQSEKLSGETEDRLESKHTYTGHTLGVVSVAVEATGTYAASSALDSFIRVWNLKDSTTKAIIETQPSETWQITYAPHGDHLQIAAACADHAFDPKKFVMQRCILSQATAELHGQQRAKDVGCEAHRWQHQHGEDLVGRLRRDGSRSGSPGSPCGEHRCKFNFKAYRSVFLSAFRLHFESKAYDWMN